jgi:chromosomal replication initiation ATPase DnaA
LQLILPIQHPANFSEEAWINGPENQEATQAVLKTPWPHSFLCVYGEKGSGKTHLAHVWAEKNKALPIPLDVCHQTLPREIQAKAYLIDDADTLKDNEWLFHFYNKVIEEKSFCLLTSTLPPAQWNVLLPDLLSRLKTIPTVHLMPMGDAFLKHIMHKQFLDEGFVVQETALDFLLLRIERSPDQIREFIKYIVQKATEEKKQITKHFISRLFQENFDSENA